MIVKNSQQISPAICGKIIFLLLSFLLYTQLIFSQIQNIHNVTETSTKHILVADTGQIIKSTHQNASQRADNYKQKYLLNFVDTAYSTEPYLVSKKDCEFVKSIDADGCVIIRYSDGLVKKVCNGYISEVITQDGRLHIIRPPNYVRDYVMRVPYPPNPAATANSSDWLNAYNLSLLDKIEKLLKNNATIKEYQSREKANCRGNIYREIEYKTIFLEEFFKAN